MFFLGDQLAAIGAVEVERFLFTNHSHSHGTARFRRRVLVQAELSVQAKMNMTNEVAIPMVKQMLSVRGDLAQLFAADLFGFILETSLRRSHD